jgi:hypothetical protein
VDFEVAVDEPIEQILRSAEETKANLIVMDAKPEPASQAMSPHTKPYE